MKIFKYVFFISILSISTTSCFEDRDDNPVAPLDIKDFVWKGMNAFYLYKDEIPDLANDRFSSDSDYTNYLNGFSSPEALFESLIYQRETIDRFSVLVDDYIALEQLFDGITKHNGMEFGLFRFNQADTDIYGYVRYVLPNTDAESEGLQRGDLFNAVDGVQLTVNNWRSLLSPENYTITLADYQDNGTPEISDDSVVPTSDNISLTKSAYTENPIYINSILNVDGNNVGYLMYNGFTGTPQFDSQLNAVFGEFQSAGITDLVLDLRYNGGGSVNTAIWLASMITGQFTGDTFFTEQYNSDIQSQLTTQDITNPFTDMMIRTNVNGDVVLNESINHLNLSRVYILTTGSSASASELVINGLNPYVDVVQIGTNTLGKPQASTTLYDSDNFSKSGADPTHTYAIQPLIYKSINVSGNTDYFEGLSPDISLGERYGNLGILGDVNEPLLAAAIADIEGTGRYSYLDEFPKEYKNSKDLVPFSDEMYSDKPLIFDHFQRMDFQK